jgi:hypothetical protein
LWPPIRSLFGTTCAFVRFFQIAFSASLSLALTVDLNGQVTFESDLPWEMPVSADEAYIALDYAFVFLAAHAFDPLVLVEKERKFVIETFNSDTHRITKAEVIAGFNGKRYFLIQNTVESSYSPPHPVPSF